MGDVVTFPGRAADPAAARNLAGVAQARAALRRGRARAIDHDVDADPALDTDPLADDRADHPAGEVADRHQGAAPAGGPRRVAEEGRR